MFQGHCPCSKYFGHSFIGTDFKVNLRYLKLLANCFQYSIVIFSHIWFLTSKGAIQIHHPPRLQDLAENAAWCSPNTKSIPKGWRYATAKIIKKSLFRLWSQFQKGALNTVLASGHIFHRCFYPCRVNRGTEAIWKNTFLCDGYKVRFITFIHLEICIIVANTKQSGKLIHPLGLIHSNLKALITTQPLIKEKILNLCRLPYRLALCLTL